MVKLIEVVDEQGEPSKEPKDIIKEFLDSGMNEAKFEESEVGRSDKKVNNFMARTRVYLKYHKYDKMVDISRKKPYIFLKRIDKKEVEDDVNGNDTDEKHSIDG